PPRHRRSRPPERPPRQHPHAPRPRPHRPDLPLSWPQFPPDRRRRQDRSGREIEKELMKPLLLLFATSIAFAANPTELVHQAAVGWQQAAVKQDAAGLNRFL